MSNKSEMQKIKRYSRVLRFVMNVFYWVSLVTACISFIAAVATIFIPASKFIFKNNYAGSFGLSLDGLIKYNLTEAAQGISLKDVYLTILFMSVVLLFLVAFVAKKLVHILKSVENDSPFEKENAERILAIGRILVLSALFIPALKFIPAKVLLDLVKMQNIDLNYSVNIYLLLAGFLMFVLSGIFKYGSYLQSEYDETV
jgi:hypothetical protein